MIHNYLINWDTSSRCTQCLIINYTNVLLLFFRNVFRCDGFKVQKVISHDCDPVVQFSFVQFDLIVTLELPYSGTIEYPKNLDDLLLTNLLYCHC
jgi:hypothetical protein